MTTPTAPEVRPAASRLTMASALLAAHAVALAFGLVGMLVMIPNPSLWAGDPAGIAAFRFGMEHAGALHILLGAAAMLAYGGRALGWRRTAVFFALSCAISLGSELIGTGTGWPFGNYEYTEGLGAKILGRVPYSIPLSWFYMGLACYLLAAELARWRGLRPRAAWSVGLGAYLMVVWDRCSTPRWPPPRSHSSSGSGARRGCTTACRSRICSAGASRRQHSWG